MGGTSESQYRGLIFVYKGIEKKRPHTGIFIDYKYFKLLAEVEKQIGSNWYADKTKYHIEANIPILRNLGMAVEYRYDNNQQGKNVEEYLTSLRYYF